MTLVTDRTAADVARLLALKAIGWANMTTAERAEYIGSPSALAGSDGYVLVSADGYVLYAPTGQQNGAYNAGDLNRVGEAVDYIAARMAAAGYGVTVAPKIDWAIGDIPSTAQMATYLADIAAIRAALAVTPDTPAVPSTMDDLTVDAANAIESILWDVDGLINNMMAAYRHAGAFYAGQGGLRL